MTVTVYIYIYIPGPRVVRNIRMWTQQLRLILQKTSRGVTSSLPHLECDKRLLPWVKMLAQLKIFLKLSLTTCHFEYSIIRYIDITLLQYMSPPVHSIYRALFTLQRSFLGATGVGIEGASTWSYLRQSLRSGSADMADMRQQEGAKANCSEMASKC